MRLEPGIIVQHFKRELEKDVNMLKYVYKIESFALHTETEERLVIYSAMYNDPERNVYVGTTFARPMESFMAEVDHEKYPDVKQKFRFEELDPKQLCTKQYPFPYNVGEPAEIFYNGAWRRGTIVDGYRFRDGIVSVNTDMGVLSCGEARTDIYRPLKE